MFDAVIAVILTSLVLPTEAHAYIDPGAGMLVLQAAIAAVGAFFILVKRPFHWIGTKLKSMRRPDARP